MLRSLAMIVLLATANVNASALAAPPEDNFFLHDGDRVLILGDSITQAGRYVDYLDAYLATRFPDRSFTLIPLGLSSETITGLSEPDHPFPRPDVLERLGRALEKTKPDVVVFSYGMNDGIYHPFSRERFEAYQKGITRAIERAREAGARVSLITPPPFDASAFANRVKAEDAGRFSYAAPFEGYDGVLESYAEWLRTLSEQKGVPVADAHEATERFLKAARQNEPGLHLAGDGIHPDATGHALIALEVLRSWGIPDVDPIESATIDAKEGKAEAGAVRDIRLRDDSLSFVWTARTPMPRDRAWHPRLLEIVPDLGRLNALRLVIRKLPEGRYRLMESDTELGRFDVEELAEGIELGGLTELSANRRAVEVLDLIERRRAILAPAWLSAVGHKRPGVTPGLPLPEAERQAKALSEQIRTLAQPADLTLRLEPIRP